MKLIISLLIISSLHGCASHPKPVLREDGHPPYINTKTGRGPTATSFGDFLENVASIKCSLKGCNCLHH